LSESAVLTAIRKTPYPEFVARLSESDYRQVLDVLREAATVDGPVPFTEPVLDALRRVVPCDVVAYHERPHPKARRAIVWSGEPRGPVTPAVAAAQRRLENQDPLPPSPGARKFSDLFSRAEYHRLELYQEVARPLGVEDMFRLWLDPQGEAAARLEFDRPDRRFRERDRDVLDLLRPHLEQFRRSALRRRSVFANSAESLTPRELEILHLVAEGCTNAEVARILWISARTVNKHLENAYEKLGVHTRTGAVAAIRPVSRERAG
jgi:DNA-binding CsgD family transcriptional regulator